ncbi:YcjX family protein, partial [Escherichia sp. HC-CC]
YTLPDNACAKQSQPAHHQFEAFRPQVMDVDKPLPHIRLDAALEFLIGDKLR